MIVFSPTIIIEFYSIANRTTTEEANAGKEVITHTWIGSCGIKIGSLAPKTGSKYWRSAHFEHQKTSLRFTV